MLLKVMPLGCDATSGSLVTCTFPVGRCGSNTAHTAKHSHSNCDEQHNTHRPTVTLKTGLPNYHTSARNHKQLFSSPSSHNQHSHLRHTPLDVILFQAFRTQICFIVFTWNSSNFSSGQCVRLRLCCAQRNHVLFCTLDIDDTNTNSHGYEVETLLIFRVRFPHRFLRHCWAKNCKDTLALANSLPSSCCSSQQCSGSRQLFRDRFSRSPLRCHKQCPAYRVRDRLQCPQPLISPLRDTKITHRCVSHCLCRCSCVLQSDPRDTSWSPR